MYVAQDTTSGEEYALKVRCYEEASPEMSAFFKLVPCFVFAEDHRR